MKTRVHTARVAAFCVMFVASLVTLSAQSFVAELVDPSPLQGTTASSLEHHGTLTNNSPMAKDIICRYYDRAKFIDHAASMCITTDLCYELPDSFFGEPYDMPMFRIEGNTTIVLKAILNPVGKPGTSTLRFTIFDKENPADSVPYAVTFVVDQANSVRDLHEVADVVVSPNPSSDRVVINSTILSEAIALDVYASDGELLSTQRHDGSQRSSINVSSLPAGSYHVVVTLTSGAVYRTPISVVR